jgi:arylsulfatase A-like enzyme
MTARPNIVLLVMDTARAREILKYPDIGTTIHRLADSGSNYRQAFASAPWTLPSHASLFTGTYSSKHGAHAGHKHLGTSLTTLGEVFQSSGYETVSVSNNTWISEEFGFARGFDTFHKTWQYVQSTTDLGEIARTKDGMEMVSALATQLVNGNPFVNVANAIYGQFFRKRNDDGARRTNEWLAEWLSSRNDRQPFFLFVNYLEPHIEYDPPKSIAEQYLPDGISYDEAREIPQDAWGYIAGDVDLSERDFDALRALYRAEIDYLDDRIGELRDELIAAGEWENTVFVVTSDHGENIGDHGFMDHQYCLYDTLLHVPLVIHGDSFDGKGETDRLVQTVDLAPTLLDAAEIDAPEAYEQFQGQSFYPGTDTDPREHVIAEYMAPQPSIEALEKSVGTLSDEIERYDRSLRAIRTEDYKLIRGSDNSRELYAIAADSRESENIADEKSDRVSELGDRLDDWLDSFEHADSTESVSMKDQTKERLEDLGYLQ